MTDSLRELDCQIAQTFMGWKHQNDHWWHSSWSDIHNTVGCERVPAYSTDIAAAMMVVERMYKEHQLSCRIAYANDQQVAVAFYTAFGAQHILTEKMDVKGWDTSGTVPLAICRAALQAKITLDGLKKIEDRQKPVDDNA